MRGRGGDPMGLGTGNKVGKEATRTKAEERENSKLKKKSCAIKKRQKKRGAMLSFKKTGKSPLG